MIRMIDGRIDLVHLLNNSCNVSNSTLEQHTNKRHTFPHPSWPTRLPAPRQGWSRSPSSCTGSPPWSKQHRDGDVLFTVVLIGWHTFWSSTFSEHARYSYWLTHFVKIKFSSNILDNKLTGWSTSQAPIFRTHPLISLVDTLSESSTFSEHTRYNKSSSFQTYPLFPLVDTLFKILIPNTCPLLSLADKLFKFRKRRSGSAMAVP